MIIYAAVITACFVSPEFRDNMGDYGFVQGYYGFVQGYYGFVQGRGKYYLETPVDPNQNWTNTRTEREDCHSYEKALAKTEEKCTALSVAEENRVREGASQTLSKITRLEHSCVKREVEQ